MTKSKTTKRALLVSALSMLLCLAMLVGTTFAWFTDTVTTGKNTIVAGNLDVELYARDSEDNYNAVGADDSLFDNDALWEPGHTEVAYLKVANNGTLALKYKLSVTVDSETSGTNVNGEEFKLSDYLVFGQITDTEDIPAYATREEAQEAAGSTMGLGNYTPQESTLSSGETAYVALIVYMPTTVGNEANYKTDTTAPQIELGVSLVATQTTYEEDGFGDDYDKDAVYPAITDLTANDADSISTALQEAKDWDTIALTGNIDFGTESFNITGTDNITIDGQGRAITATSSDSKSYDKQAVFSDTNFASGAVSSGITVKNLIIDNTDSTGWACVIAGGATFENCTFKNGAVYITPKSNANDVTFTNCTFENAAITIACAEGTDECNLTMTGNTFIITEEDQCAFALYVRAADGFGTKNNSSLLKTTVTGNTFVNKTGVETYCAYQVLQEARKSGDETSLLLNSENADVPVYSENTYDSGAGYIYEERTSSPRVTSSLIPINSSDTN